MKISYTNVFPILENNTVDYGKNIRIKYSPNQKFTIKLYNSFGQSLSMQVNNSLNNNYQIPFAAYSALSEPVIISFRSDNEQDGEIDLSYF